MCMKKKLVFVIRRYYYITKKFSTLGIYVDVLKYVGHIRRRNRLELRLYSKKIMKVVSIIGNSINGKNSLRTLKLT